jgi:hypothetical protein
MSAVPEPTSLVLLVLGSVVAAWIKVRSDQGKGRFA